MKKRLLYLYKAQTVQSNWNIWIEYFDFPIKIEAVSPNENFVFNIFKYCLIMICKATTKYNAPKYSMN